MRDILRLQRQIRLIATITAVAGIIFGVGAIIRTAPYGIAKLVVEHELSKIFKQRVTIDRMSGNIVSVAHFEGIRFYNHPSLNRPGTVVLIGEATARYNLIKVMAHNGDFAAGTHTLTIRKLAVTTLRTKTDQWNVLMILPPPEPQAPPLSFTGRIYIDDSTIEIRDEKGWGNSQPNSAFVDHVTDLAGVVDFHDIRDAKMVFSGKLGLTKAPFRIIGNLNSTNGQWDYRINISDLNLTKWGPYMIDNPSLSVMGGTLDAEVHIHSKYLPNQHEFPFWYDLVGHIRDTTLSMPIFPASATKMSGMITMANNHIESDQVMHLGNHPETPIHLIKSMVDTGIIDSEGHIYATIHSVGELKNRLPNRFKGVAPRLFPLLNHPNTRLSIHSIKCQIANSPIVATGYLTFDPNTIHVSLASKTLDVATIKSLFPATRAWKITGNGPVLLTISGAMTSPTVSGDYTPVTAKAYGFPVADLALSFRYFDHSLNLNTSKGTIYSGPIQLACSANFSTIIPTIEAEFISRQMDTTRLTSSLTGRASTRVHISGPTKKLALMGELMSDSTIGWMNQTITHASVQGWILDATNLLLEKGTLSINQSSQPINFFGIIRNWTSAEFAYSGASIVFRDIEIGSNGYGIGTVSGKLSAILTDDFWANPRSTLVVTANGTLENPSIYRQVFDRVLFDITLEPSITRIRQLDLITGGGALSGSGIIEGKIPRHLFITASNFGVSENSIFQKIIPNSLKPFAGILSGSAIVESKVPKSISLNYGTIVASGNIRLTQGEIRGQSFDHLLMVGTWDGEAFTVENSIFKKNNSLISISGRISSDTRMDLTISDGTTVNLSDFSQTIAPIMGKLSGTGSVSGSIQGYPDNPNIMLFLKMNPLEIGTVKIQSVVGGIGIINGKLTASRLTICPREGQIDIDGYFELSQLNSPKNPPLNYAVSLTVTPMRLEFLVDLIEGIRFEWMSRVGNTPPATELQISAANITSDSPKNTKRILVDDSFNQAVPILYSLGSKHSIKTLQIVDELIAANTITHDLGISDSVSGLFSAKIDARSRPNLPPEISADIHCEDATISFLHGKEISVGISSKANELTYTFRVRDGDMGGSSFDLLQSTGTYDTNGYLSIETTDIMTQRNKSHSILSGKFPISAYWNPDHVGHPMNLLFTWKGDDVNMLSLVIPHIKQIKNEGTIALRMEGPLDTPTLSTERVSLVNASILLNDQMSPITSPLEIISGTFAIKNNKATISDIRFKWRGVDTLRLGSSNPDTDEMLVRGSVTIDHFSLLNPDTAILGMNLAFNDATIAVNFPQIYQGLVEIHQLTINGPYKIPISRHEKSLQKDISGTERETGPLISATVHFSEGELSMPTIGERNIRPNFTLDIKGFIKKNISLVGSVIGENLLAGFANRFDLSIAETISPVVISGTLNSPKIQNSITVSTGFITAINRQFEILSIDRQREYYRNNQYKIHNNTVAFQTDYSSTKSRLIPQLNVTALAVMDPLEVASSNLSADTDLTKYTHVLITIAGSAYSLDGFQFDKYLSSSSEASNRLEFRGSYRLSNGGDASEIAKILAPELLANTGSGSQANSRILTQLGTGAVNYISQVALRGVQRNLAQNIGLDDIQINYNLGDALFKTDSNKAVGVSLGKSLFSNQLYVKARTNVNLERQKSGNTLQLSDIELTYYLEKNLSLNYANFIDSVGDSKNRYNIKYSYDF